MSARVGLFVGRLQPLHKGHCKTINLMIQDCDTVIIGLGSAQKSREKHDPWTVEERIEMLRNVYSDRIKIVPLNDIDAATPEQWCGYIFDKLKKLGMKEPTDYYTGSEFDSSWYKHHFKERLHICDRSDNPVPAATELRMSLELRTNDWKFWVPAVNHQLVESTYPEEFKIPINSDRQGIKV